MAALLPGACVGAGGVAQSAPDAVRAGDPATVTVDASVWGYGGPIRGRYRDVTLFYRLAGADSFRAAPPPRRVPVGERRERYEFTIPAYAAQTCGWLEYYVVASFDGQPPQTTPGTKRIRVDPRPGGAAAARDTVVASPCALARWVAQAVGDARAEFPDAGGGHAPRGDAGLPAARGIRLRVDTGQRNAAFARTEQFAGLALSELTALGFSTYVVRRGRADATPFLVLVIDRDGNGVPDDELRFTPTPALRRWQAWDALGGRWRRAWAHGGGAPGDPGEFRTLDAYRAVAPGARLVSAVTVGAWRVGGARPLVAAVDRVVVGAGGRTTVFEFAPARAGPP